jgi:transposase-like protein
MSFLFSQGKLTFVKSARKCCSLCKNKQKPPLKPAIQLIFQEGQAPQAVATFERDFEQTLVFYGISGLAPAWIRTTSLLERTNRELRRKFRQAVTFGSLTGAEVAVYLQIQRLHARWSKQSWWDASHLLFFELWNLHP